MAPPRDGDSPPRDRSAAGRSTTAAVALAVAGLLVISRGASFTDLVAVVAAPCLLWLCWRAPGAPRLGTAPVALAGAAAMLAALALSAGLRGPVVVVVTLLAGGLALLVAVLTDRWSPRRTAWGAVALAAGSAVVLAALLQGQVTIDVWSLHATAADRLAAGATPWQGLGVDNGSAFVPDDAVIDGYPYPLPALLAYALGAWLAGDPRWAGVVLWIGALGGLAAMVRHRRPAAVLLVLLAMAPGSLALLRNSWTEPVILAGLVGAVALWRTRPVASAVLLGVALASKQYLVPAGAALLVAPLPDRWRRVVTAGGAAAAVLTAGFLLGSGYLEAVVGFHLEQPARPDSANLFGLVARLTERPTAWPGWAGPAAGVVAGVVLGRRAHGPADLMWAFAGSLTATFLFAGQAFPNYWLLVLGLVVLAGLAARSAGEEGAGRVRHPRSLRSVPG